MYKDNKPIPAGFVCTSLLGNEHKQREYLPSFNPKDDMTQMKVMQHKLFIHVFSLTGLLGGSQTKIGVQEK